MSFMFKNILLLQELRYREEVVPVSLINQRVGIRETADTIATLLTRMCLCSEVVDGGKAVKVEIPPTRAGTVQYVCIPDVCVHMYMYIVM